ncbi:MAG: B12-binding domain-containing radical SAM protein [Peptococcaceae bacterium]|nr:B12-binding domain-containing radical SAM protein [Peptococcaceae bacterium]
MNILLINPPANDILDPIGMQRRKPEKTWVPLGIAYLGSTLSQAGYDVTVRDMHSYAWDNVKSELENVKPDVIGISCFTMWRAGAIQTAKLARQCCPEAHIILGGPHASLFPEQMFRLAPVDTIVIGEGEITMVELAGVLAKGGDRAGVKGIAYQEAGRIVKTDPRPTVKDLESLPFPLYESFDLDEYKSPEIPPPYLSLKGTHIISSRGCPFSCRFCSVNRFWGKQWRPRSPRNVVDELQWLYQAHGVRHVYFSDDIFTLDQDRTVEICREILRRKLEMVWMAETRVDCVTREMLTWMRKAGCYRIYYGVESGSPTILKNVKKGFTVQKIKEAFAATHEAGIQPCCFLMVGNPGENETTIDETVALIKEIRPATVPIMGLTQILPGSALYEFSKSQGLITDDFWLGNKQAPFYTGEHTVNELIALQLRLTRGVAPELYQMLRSIGLDENYLRMRSLFGEK